MMMKMMLMMMTMMMDQYVLFDFPFYARLCRTARSTLDVIGWPYVFVSGCWYLHVNRRVEVPLGLWLYVHLAVVHWMPGSGMEQHHCIL